MDDDTPRLTEGLARCDERAWREFHERYFDVIQRLAVSRGSAASEAPEVVQRVYLRVLRHAKPFATADAFTAWLACLTRCETVDAARGLKRRAWLGERFQQWQEYRGPEPRHPLAEPLAEAINTLAADDRGMLTRHYRDGWSHQRIADQWRTSAKAVESRLARLRKRLPSTPPPPPSSPRSRLARLRKRLRQHLCP